MPRRKKQGTPRPTEAELEVLRVLWNEGPCTVRQVHDILSQDQRIGYTTVLKFLQIMHEKGLVTRDDAQRAHVYSPAMSKEYTQRQLLGDFVGNVFEGSAAQLVLQALGTNTPTDPRELQKIRELIDELEADRGDDASGSLRG